MQFFEEVATAVSDPLGRRPMLVGDVVTAGEAIGRLSSVGGIGRRVRALTVVARVDRRLDRPVVASIGDLSTEQRLQIFITKAADGREDQIKRLADSAPRYEYTATDIEYTDGVRQVYMLSLLARHQLQQNYLAIDQHETARDKQMALMMVNEILSRLSRGGFGIDEFGNIGAPEHDDAEYAYDETASPDTACLATKYRELWEDVPAELLLDEDDRAMKYFTNLAAGGLIAYRTDLSGEAFDEFEKDHVSSGV